MNMTDQTTFTELERNEAIRLDNRFEALNGLSKSVQTDDIFKSGLTDQRTSCI